MAIVWRYLCVLLLTVIIVSVCITHISAKKVDIDRLKNKDKKMSHHSAGSHSSNSGVASDANDWSKLVGKTGEEAKSAILSGNPDLKVHILPEGAMVTMDFKSDRVRVYVNKEGNVVSTPNVG